MLRYVVDKWLSPILGDRRLFVELLKEQPPSGNARRN
jgi:hypothetical protein